MKLQYKIALMIFGFGSLFLVSLASISYLYNRSQYTKNLHIDLRDTARERARHVEIALKEKARVARTLSSTPMIVEALARSNAEYASMAEAERQEKISRLNDRWRETAEASDPFVQSYMTNPVAGFLKEHMGRTPGEYGEIFLTNRYGSIIATTEKLTTLAHAHKYWWLAAFAEGKGRVFFDDRGFDASVEGYVAGVVVPVMKDTKVIGILKCNVNITGVLLEAIEGLRLGETGRLKIARSGGRVVLEKDKEPLSTKLPPVIVERMKTRAGGSIVIEDGEETLLAAYAPVSITAGSAEYAFGGKHESIDHIMGNRGELWYAFITQDLNEALSPLRENLLASLFIGFLTVVLMGMLSIFFGRKMALPVVRMESLARRVGEGDFDVQMDARSKDELGHLAEGLNAMVLSLRKATNSQKQAEDELKKAHSELELRVEERSLELAKANVELQAEVKDRKQMEGALKKSEIWLSNIYNSLEEAVFVVTPDRKLKNVNNATEKIFGYSKDELIGHSTEILHVDNAHYLEFGQRIKDAFDRGETACFDFEAKRKSGELFPTEHAVSLLKDDSGNQLGIVSVVRDITERKKVEEALRYSEEELHYLFGHMQWAMEEDRKSIAREIHDELGQALTALKIDVSLLGDELPVNHGPLNKQVKSMLETINLTIRAVKRITKKLRPEILDELGLAASIDWYAKECQNRSAISYEIKIEYDDDNLSREISTALFRVFQETMTNILRHSGATRVKVYLGGYGEGLCLKVTDNGVGIKNKQVADTMSTGLTGMKERIRFLDGEFRIRGIQGVGSTVKAYVPIKGET